MPKPLTVWITTNWEILQGIGIPDHLTCLPRNLYAGHEKQVEPVEQWTGSKLGKEYIKAVYFHPVYLTYMQSSLPRGHNSGTIWSAVLLKCPRLK